MAGRSAAAQGVSVSEQTSAIHPSLTTTVAQSISFSPSNNVTWVIWKLFVDLMASSTVLKATAGTAGFAAAPALPGSPCGTTGSQAHAGVRPTLTPSTPRPDLLPINPAPPLR